MRAIVFFDLPIATAEDRRNYTKFRKTLIRNGFLMMQKSVYCRILLTQSSTKTISDLIRKNRPPAGIVQLMIITEKQFAGVEYITGESGSDVLDTDERLVVI